MRRTAVLVTFAILGSVGCAVEEENVEPERDLEAERQALFELDRETSETPSGILSLFADDVRILAPGGPMIEGVGPARAMWEELAAVPGFSLTYGPTFAEVRGDLGYTIGRYRMTAPGADRALETTEGKYLTVWRRTPDGGWEVAADMFNANGPGSAVEE